MRYGIIVKQNGRRRIVTAKSAYALCTWAGIKPKATRWERCVVDVGQRTKITTTQAATIVAPALNSIAFKGAPAGGRRAGGRRRHLAFPGKAKRNPSGQAAEIAEAFHGDIRKIHRFPMPKIPDTAYEVGKLQAVIYQPPQWSKIGRVHRIHHFSKPRPRLIGFSSRPPWLIHGGRARFTSRGFID